VTWLTRGGVIAAGAVGVGVTWGLGWPGLIVLAAFLLSGSLLTQFAEHRAPSRTGRQVLANGGVALVAAVAGSWPAAAGAIAAAAADTWATEIGAFSPFPPRLITSWRRVARGTSGGITALGTLGAAAGAVTIAWLTQALAPKGMAPLFPFVASAGIIGMLADSLLGSTLQGKFECPACDARFERGNTICHEPVLLTRGLRWLDNDGVNFAATLVGAAVGLVGSRLSRP